MQTEAVQPASFPNTIHDFLQNLQQLIGERNYRHWFLQKTQVTADDQQLRITVPTQFLLNWMQRRFSADVVEAARQQGFDGAVWSVDETLPAADDRTSQSDRTSRASSGEETPATETSAGPAARNSRAAGTHPAADVSKDPASSVRSGSPAAPRDSRRFAALDDFVVGPCNELAHTAARHVCAEPGRQFSSLYLHGPVGTGKTHLAEGIYREIRRQHPQLQVLFMSAENFANQFTQALRTHALPGFRQRFRTVDVLIMDDVGFLDGKKVIQEEFLHTFKQLVSHGRQVVMTADSHPRLLSKLRDDLVTRFLCGMVCRLEAPDLETRRLIVRTKAAGMNIQISDEVLDYVAKRFVHNVRELEGALNTLRTWFAMTSRRVSLSVARQILSELERDCIKVVKLADIQEAVCRLFGLVTDDLQSSGRTKKVTHPRMLAMYLARRHTQAAYKEIGEFFGGRNHSTVVAAEKKVETWLHGTEQIQIGGRNWHLSDVLETLEQQLLAG